MRDPNCVGALIRDHRNRVFAQRRTPARRVLPGIWDIVGGHLEAGETPELALARELEEETGWKLRRVEAVIADWEWEWDGVVRRELDYLVEVDGDPGEPTLAPREHDAFAWVGPDNLELMMEGRTPRWYGKTWTREGALRYATRRAEQWEAHGVDKWIAYDRASGELVGRGGLSRKEDEPERLEVGWTVRSDLWGRGYATEIGRAGLALAFDELGADEVVAFTGPDNQRSRAVMERLGMGDPRDIVYMGDAVVLYTLPRGCATAAGRAALHRWDDPRTTGDG
jgi:RimJ/RimL family protein N-acetyltransferase